MGLGIAQPWVAIAVPLFAGFWRVECGAHAAESRVWRVSGRSSHH